MQALRPLRFCLAALAAVCSLVALSGCASPERLKETADEEAYGIIGGTFEEVLGETRDFTVAPSEKDPLEGRGRIEPAEEPPAPDEGADLPPGATGERRLLSLHEALEVAAANSRDFQSRKETVYFEALGLIMERFRWEPQLGLDFRTWWTSDDRPSTPRTERLRARSQFSVNQMLVTGGRVGARLASNTLTFASGSRPWWGEPTLVLDFVQPLWNNAGKRVALENLTQAEYDMLYAIRDFVRFQRGFSVTIATRFYRLLQQRDQVANEESNYRSLQLARERSEMLAEAGRLPEFQVAQSRQNELRALNRFIRAQEDYRRQLDEFRIALGLPTDEPVEPDPLALDDLREEGIVPPDLGLDEAIHVALERRLDYLTALARVEDAERKVEVARIGLGWDIQLSGEASYGPDDVTMTKRGKTSFERHQYRMQLDVDVPLQRTAQRNTYVRALIALEQRKRAAEAAEDNIKLDVRGAWRRLEEAAQTYRIHRMSVDLAEQRVEGTLLLLEAGRAVTRDYLDAQEDLVNARNDLTRALMDHAVARLQFYRDIELLNVDERGLWVIEEPESGEAAAPPHEADGEADAMTIDADSEGNPNTNEAKEPNDA